MSTSPTTRGRKKTLNPSTGRSKSPSTKGKSPSRSPSPPGSSSAIAKGGKTDTEILEKAILKMFQKAGQEDDEDYCKLIKITRRMLTGILMKYSFVKAICVL